ncbi:hypothetical protein PRZ48_014725 [Zasmidium cellare]|uniref:Heterokaryon incompatibility domain-containing protein n=1 Tax=Zasmidium cellare TaxID=395010 RepID=A0ABR0DZ32_ZASCE|nr:hypothetical protein PRZ48_014725 [Zasmidium cellare]
MKQAHENAETSRSGGVAGKKSSKTTYHLRPFENDAIQEESFRLSALDFTVPPNYNTYAIVFKEACVSTTHVVETFKTALQQTLRQCRHLVGTIEPNEHGDYSIVQTRDTSVEFVVQHRQDLPSFEELQKGDFTLSSMRNHSLLGVEGMPDSKHPDERPAVIAFQLNIVPGGLIFTTHVHHWALDMTGTTNVIRQVAENCRAAVKSTVEPSSWNDSFMDRSRFLCPVVAPEELVNPSPRPPRHPDWKPCSWLLFHLPPHKAAELKSIASEGTQSRISTYDAVTALCWRIVARNRAKIYNPDLTMPAIFGQPMDMRSRCDPPMPSRYQGNLLAAGLSGSEVGEQGIEVMLPFETKNIGLLLEDKDLRKYFEFRGVEHHHYETVSYCWGDRTTPVTIQVDDKPLSVPATTAEIPRRFRHSAKPRVLWIDAVCIDQSNIEERSEQVTKMHQIYASATANLIWLGESDPETEQAIESINKVIHEIEEETDGFKTLPFSGGPNFYLHRNSGVKQNFDAKSFLELCSKPWFGRLWVVQEASLASLNLCHFGTYSFDLLTLLRVAKWLWTKREHVDLGYFADAHRVLARAWRISDFADKECGWFHHARAKGWFKSSGDGEAPEVSLTHHLLTELRNFACSQPVDHVFGLLGLYREFSGHELPGLLRPDYSKSVVEVFTDATRQAILEGENLVPFHDIYHRREGEEGEDGLDLPSWTPQWHQPWNISLDPTPLHRGFKASEDCTLSSIGLVDRGLKTISLEGEFLDKIEDMVNKHSKAKGKHEDFQTALAITLCAEESSSRALATPEDLQGYIDLKSYFTNPDAPPLGLKDSPSTLMPAARYSEASWRACYRRKFFITAAGRIGIGPQTMEKGDVIVVLYGGEWPFVLRDRGDAEWEMTGLAYVYGIMGGEAVQEAGERGEGDIWFCLK